MESFLEHVWGWVGGGGAIAVLAFLLNANKELRKLKIDAAKAKTAAHEEAARAARFEADIAGSTSKVAGEGLLRGLLVTLTEREQEAHKATKLVMDQLQEARKDRGYIREELADIKSREEQCQRNLAELQNSQQLQENAHREEMRAMRNQLNNRIYHLSQRLQKAGLAFTATDIVPDHDGLDR